MAFGRKNDFRSLREKHTMFSWTQPVGYEFAEVEAAVLEYKETISDMNELLIKKDEECNALKARCDDYIKQITEMQINYESMNIPEMSQEQSIEILDNFRNAESIPVQTHFEPQVSTHQEEYYHERPVKHHEQQVNTQPSRLHHSEDEIYNSLSMEDDYGDDDESVKKRRVERDMKKKLIEDVDPYTVGDSSGIII